MGKKEHKEHGRTYKIITRLTAFMAGIGLVFAGRQAWLKNSGKYPSHA